VDVAVNVDSNVGGGHIAMRDAVVVCVLQRAAEAEQHRLHDRDGQPPMGTKHGVEWNIVDARREEKGMAGDGSNHATPHARKQRRLAPSMVPAFNM
jgi:hypothetical protein